MRDDWKVVPFGEVCEISGGSQPPKSNFIYEPKDGYIRLVQVRDYRTDKYMTYVPIEKAKKFCTKSDIMIGRYGPPIFGIFRGIEGAYNVALMKQSLMKRN
jgi:type I restriction enzyme S subunit